MSKETIAARLKAARESAGVTQKMAADALGVTVQAISSYERAVTRIDADSLAVLCSLYGTPLDGILGIVPHEENEPAACSDGQNEINRELLALLNQLTPEQSLRVMDFVRGLLSSK